MLNRSFIFGAYLIWFLLYFLQFPLSGSLFGELDAVANLGMFKQLQVLLEHWVYDIPTGSISYPGENSWAAFGLDFGSGIIHLFFNLLGFNDLWASWFYYSIIFASNAFGLYLITTRISKHQVAAFISGLLFAASHFAFANLENPNALVFFFAFYSLERFLKFKETGVPQYLLTAGFTGAINIYFSPYNFVFHSLFWFILILYYELKGAKSFSLLKHYLLVALIYLIIISPFLYIYVIDDSSAGWMNVVKEYDAVHVLSLNPDDFFRGLSGHLYLEFTDLYNYLWLSKLKCAFLGVLFWLIGMAGLMLRSKFRVIGWIAVILGLSLAFGPYVSYRTEKLFPSIMWPFYEFFGLDSFIRIPIRGFFLTILGLSLGVAAIFQRHWNTGRSTKVVLSLLALFMLAENVPINPTKYSSDDLLNPDREMIDFLAEQEDVVVAHLPSSLFSYEADVREYKYMYWQHLHRQNILNGSGAFLSPQRQQNLKLMEKWWEDDNLATLIDINHVDYIIFHPYLENTLDLGNTMMTLKVHANLQKVFVNDACIIYQTK